MPDRVTDVIFRLRTVQQGLSGDIQKVNQEVKQTTSNVNSLNNSLKGLGRAIGATFATGQLIQFGKEAIRVSREAQGIVIAFEQLNDANLLAELRTAVRGTVDDVRLMQLAVQARNFKLPLDQLATLFEFAQRRAEATGQSVDRLVDSIVLGISRQSIKIIDNLGISARELGMEFKRTGDFTEATINIVNRELAEMGEAIDTDNTKLLQFEASWRNLTKEIGDRLLPIVGDLLEVFQAVLATTDTIRFTARQMVDAIDDSRLIAFLERTNPLVEVLLSVPRGVRDFLEGNEEVIERNLTLAEQLNKQIEDFELLNQKTKLTEEERKKLEEERIKLFEARLRLLLAEARIQNELFKSDQEALEEIDRERQEFLDSRITDLEELEEIEFRAREREIEGLSEVDKAYVESLRLRKLVIEESAKVQLETLEDFAQQAISIFNVITDRRIENLDAEIQAQENRLDRALELAKLGNEEALQLEQERLDNLLEERQRAVEQQRTLDAISFASSSAVALAEALSGPFGIAQFFTVLSLLAGIGAQVASISTSVGFYEGTEEVQGKGGKDQIHARLTKGERVVTADTNKKYFDALHEIHEGSTMAGMFQDIAAGRMDWDGIGRSLTIQSHVKSDADLLKEMRRINKNIKEMPSASINIDRNGISAIYASYVTENLKRKKHAN